MILAFLPAAAITSAFGISLFFTGYASLIYAPALTLVIAAALMILLPALGREIKIPADPGTLLLLSFWLYITLSLFWTTVPFASLVTWLVLTTLPLTYISLTQAHDRVLKYTVFGLAGILAILGVWAVLQISAFRDIFGDRAAHPLLNANSLALLMAMGLPPALAALTILPPRRGPWLTAAALCLVLAAGLIATQSRSGVLAASLAVTALLFIIRPGRRYVMAAATLLIAALMVMAPRLINLDNDPNIAARLAQWRATIGMIGDRPLTGTGLGTYYLYYPSIRPSLSDNSMGHWAHNDPLQFAAETGTGVLVIFYATLIAVLWRTWVTLRNILPDHKTGKAMIAGSFGGLVALVVQAHLDFPLYLMPVLIGAGVLLAVWHHATTFYAKPHTSMSIIFSGWQQLFMAGCVFLISGLFLILTISSAAGQYYLLQSVDAIKKGRVGDFIKNIERAEKFAPASFIDPEVQLAGFYIDLLKNPEPLFTTDEQRTMITTVADLLDRAQMLNPAWAEIDHKRALLYNTVRPALMPEGPERARESWTKTLQKNPMHDRARLALAQSLVASGNPVAAADLIRDRFQWPVGAEDFEAYKKLLDQIAPLALIQRQEQEKLNAP